MTDTPKKASNIRQAVDFGALVAFMAAYAVNRFARGLDRARGPGPGDLGSGRRVPDRG